ncbi:MAG: hypothetical protein SGI73_01015 [Chloroflexota bacterium]|nr:hypothetical protein [Chloroflexota bacterium]
MPFINIEPLPGEPIFVLHFEGQISSEDVKTAYQTTNAFWNDALRVTGWHIIIQLEKVENDFVDTINVLRATGETETQFSTVMPYITQYVVGTDAMSRLYSESRRLPQFGGRLVAPFRRYEDALEAARQNVRSRLAADASTLTVDKGE